MVAVPLVVGSEPSVVYVIWSTPDPASLAERVTETDDVYQPPAHGEPSHWIVVEGTLPSGVTVNDVGSETAPALFVAVTSFGSAGFVAPLVKLYVVVGPDGEPLQPLPRAGKPYDATPDSPSLELAVTSKEPAAPVR